MTTTVNGTSGNDFIHVAGDGLTPPAGYTDIPKATNADDTIIAGGGNDIIFAGDGIDTVKFYDQFTAADQVDGQGGVDTVTLKGDYSGIKGVVFNANTMVNVEQIVLGDGYEYDLTSNNGNVAAGKSLTVDASLLTGAAHIVFDGSAELDGSFVFKGGAGNDHILGGAKADSFDLSTGGDDFAVGGSMANTFTMGAAMTAADSIDGGGDKDTVALNGDYSGAHGIVFGASTMVNVEKLILANGFEYDLTTNDNTVAAGKLLTVDGSALTGAAHMVFNGIAETNGSFSLIGGAGDDSMSGGAKSDTFDLTAGGTDGAYGAGGADTFLLGATLSSADSIHGGSGTDTIVLDGDYGDAHALGLGSGNIDSIEILQLTAGHAYTIDFGSDDLIAAGASLLIDGSTLGAIDTMNIDNTVETDSSISIKGGAADDTFLLSRPFTNTSTIDGGAGNDTVSVRGDYSAGFVFGSSTMTNVEKMYVTSTGHQSFTLDENTIAAGQTLVITRTGVSAADSLSIDASADSDGRIVFEGNMGDDYVYATAGNDYLSGGSGHDEMYGLWGKDTFDFQGNFDALDKLDGGALDDTLKVQGDYSAGIVFNDTTIKNIELIDLFGGNSYKFTSADGNVASSATLTVDGSGLSGADVLTFDGSAETDGHFNLIGGGGNDVLTGGGQSDTFVLNEGGDDIVKGGGGDDLFAFVANGSGLTGADQIDGGAGNDTVEIFGLSSPVTFGATSLVSVETIAIDQDASNISLTMNDANVAAGATLAVTYNSPLSTDGLFFDGTAETNGNFVVSGTGGADIIKTGGGADTINIGQGNEDEVIAGSGNDTINAGSAFSTSDYIDGGVGTDTLALSGNYTLTLSPAMMSNIEVMTLTGRSGQAKYTITTVNSTVASGATLKVDGHNATWLNFNGSAETNGKFNIIGSNGADTVVTGSGNDTIKGGLGHDDLSGKSGNDVFVYGAVAESTGQTRDLLRDFIASSDKFDLNVAVTGVDAKITSGAMHEASFTGDLAAAVNGSNLAAHHAAMFVASSGDLMNHAFLVVDANGVAGFQAGADYVMEINNPGIIGKLTTANFI